MTGDPAIREIRAGEVLAARRLIYTVARGLFHPEMTVDEAASYWDARGVLRDLDDVQASYFANGGVFLVMHDGELMIGTGAFTRLVEGVCELRRLYLLPEYQGHGLGYAMMTELLNRARAIGYRKMCLLTDRFAQSRAVDFYRRLGFAVVPREGDDDEDLWMEMDI